MCYIPFYLFPPSEIVTRKWIVTLLTIACCLMCLQLQTKMFGCMTKQLMLCRTFAHLLWNILANYYLTDNVNTTSLVAITLLAICHSEVPFAFVSNLEVLFVKGFISKWVKFLWKWMCRWNTSSWEWCRRKTSFHKEAKDNLEMVYYLK